MPASIRLYEQDSDTCIYETHVFSASFSRGLSKSLQWSASLPLDKRLYDLLTATLYAEIIYDGNYGIGGKVQEINIQFDQDGSIEIKGLEEIDELYEYPADTSLYLSSRLLILGIFDLLDRAGWRLGAYRDVDLTRVVTLDLRKQQTLLGQLAELIKQAPELQYRFGGFDYADQPMLDVSVFEDLASLVVQMPSNKNASSGFWIQKITTTDKFADRAYAAQVTGGNVTDPSTRNREIILYDALTNDPTLLFDDEYPIYEELDEIIYTILPVKEGSIGGKTASIPSTFAAFAVGETSGAGTANTWGAIIFQAYPGMLKEISFRFMAITAALLTALNAGTNFIDWELKEVDESNVLSLTNPNLASGTLDGAQIAANTRYRLEFDETLEIEHATRYMLRLGLRTTAATSNVFQLTAGSPNNTKAFRLDRATAQASVANTNVNSQPMVEIITTGIVPSKGVVLIETETKFAPPKTNTMATQAEVNAAGAALYAWGVEQLRARDLDYHAIEVDAIGTDFSLRPGDTVEIRARPQFVNASYNEWETRVIESIQYSIRDGRIETQLRFKPNRPDTEVQDESVALYDIQKSTNQTPQGRVVVPFYSWTLTELTEIVQNKTANTTLSDGTRAVLVSFTVPSAPVGMHDTRIIGTPYATHENALIPLLVEVVQKPTDANPTTLICKVGIKNAGWTLYDSAVVKAHIVWR